MQELLDAYREAVYELAITEHLNTTDWDEVFSRVNNIRAEIDALLIDMQDN